MSLYLGTTLIDSVLTTYSTTTFNTQDATAIASDLLIGKTAYVKGSKITGTMPNHGAATASLNCGGSYVIPQGYHNGSGKVTANSLASQTSASATAATILRGYTAWVNGAQLTGTLPQTTYGTALPSSATNGDNFFLSQGATLVAGAKTIAASTSSYAEAVPSGSTTLSYTQTTGFNASTITFTAGGASYSIPWVRSASDGCTWNLSYSITWTPPGGSATTVASSTLSSISTSGTITGSVNLSASAAGTGTLKITLTFSNATLGTSYTYSGSATTTAGTTYKRYLRSSGSWVAQ